MITSQKHSQNSLQAFKPRCLGDMIRLGRAFDGGYIVNERVIPASRYLLSFGVNDDWSFEADFLNLKPDVQILCFDHSVSRRDLQEKTIDALNQILSARFILGAMTLNFRGVRNKFQALRRAVRLRSDFSKFFSRDNIQFFSKGVSNIEDSHFVTISEVFHMIPPDQLLENSVFMKMDIEQSEFRVLPELLEFEKYLSGMVIEFHDLDIFWPIFVNVMNQLKANFEVTHLHGNNHLGLIPNSKTPRLLEITFLKRSLICGDELQREAEVYPIPGLDQPNDSSKEDHPLYF